MEERMLIEFIDTIKDIAPQAWSVLMEQAYLNAYVNALWAVVFVLGGVLGVYTGARAWRELEDVELTALAWALSAALFMVSAWVASVAVRASINPEYYAMKLLADMISGG
jgi:cation transporter-like permease